MVYDIVIEGSQQWNDNNNNKNRNKINKYLHRVNNIAKYYLPKSISSCVLGHVFA